MKTTKVLQTNISETDISIKFSLEEILAPVAQLDRASDFGSEGWGFESLQAC